MLCSGVSGKVLEKLRIFLHINLQAAASCSMDSNLILKNSVLRESPGNLFQNVVLGPQQSALDLATLKIDINLKKKLH